MNQAKREKRMMVEKQKDKIRMVEVCHWWYFHLTIFSSERKRNNLFVFYFLPSENPFALNNIDASELKNSRTFSMPPANKVLLRAWSSWWNTEHDIKSKMIWKYDKIPFRMMSALALSLYFALEIDAFVVHHLLCRMKCMCPSDIRAWTNESSIW